MTVDTVSGEKGQVYGQATVKVVDNCGNPVAQATVTGRFTGDFDEQKTGQAGDNGMVVFQTAAQTKKPSFGFLVDNIDHATLT